MRISATAGDVSSLMSTTDIESADLLATNAYFHHVGGGVGAAVGAAVGDVSGLMSTANIQSADLLATDCLLYTSPSPRDATLSRMPSSA